MKWSGSGILFAALVAALGTLPAGSVAAATSDLTIHVQNVLAAGGILRLGLYDEARYPDDDSKPIASADVPATADETVIMLHGIAPGTYAIQAFQDVNSNNKMDTSWVGLPLEPFGFSRDAAPFLSKPSFDDVKFVLAPGGNVQVLHLQNSIKKSPTDKARDAVRARQRR